MLLVSFRTVENLLSFLLETSGPVPYLIVFSILLACGFGFPMPEDVVLFAAAMMSYYGAAELPLMIVACFVGVMVGDSLVFWIGAKYGRKAQKLKFMKRLLPSARRKRVRRKLHEQGGRVIFAARFMPGLRMPVFFTAGTLHLPFRVFFFYDGLAALISVPTIVFAVYYFGDHVDWVIQWVKTAQFGVAGGILLFVALLALKIWWARKKERELEGKAVA